MGTGLELLADVRARSAAGHDLGLGEGSGDLAADVERAAVVATLLSAFTPDDAPLARELTRQEIAFVAEGDFGCGDVLLACCWLLFMLGHVEDAALIWCAKNINFDTACYVDSVFLLARGRAETAQFAREHGISDLAQWLEGEWLDDTEEAIEGWRSGSFFAQAPPATAPVEELASWIRQ